MTQHIALPVRLIDGDLNICQQDTPVEIASSALAVLRTPRGHLRHRPDLGLEPQHLVQGGANPEQIRQALERHEPRAAQAAITTGPVSVQQVVRAVLDGDR